jgi:PAS domain S-box-containing protein
MRIIKNYTLYKIISYVFVSLLIIAALYFSSLYNFLLFHGIAELFSIAIAFSIFTILWNTRQIHENSFFIIIGIAFLFVGMTDLIHTMAYKGMNIFKGYTADLPTQLWIGARYLQSLSLLMAAFFIKRKIKISLMLPGYFIIFSLFFISIFYWDIFPICFIEGKGLTSFKIISEYIISGIILISIALLFKNKSEFEKDVFILLVASMIITIVEELFFTFYIHVYGLSNLMGHFFKILSFYLIYKAIIVTSIKNPYKLIFRKLSQSESKLRIVLQNMPIMLDAFDDKGNVIVWNRECELTTGYSANEILNNSNVLQILYPDESYRTYMLEETSKNRNQFRNLEFDITCKDGRKKTILWSSISKEFPIPNWDAWAIGVDITKQKDVKEKIELMNKELHASNEELKTTNEKLIKTQDELQSSLEEKEILLNEIHHRVKNNFQIITSMINLQEMEATDKKIINALQNPKSRIMAMSLIHERLYQSGNLAAVEFSEYIRIITNEIYQTYNLSDKKIKFDINTKKIDLSIDKAIPCGLILNELLTNIFKYAFPSEWEGTASIEVTLQQKEKDIIELRIRDNGIGLPAEINLKESKTLGLKLIPLLVKQIKGEYELNRKDGTEFIIRFPG